MRSWWLAALGGVLSACVLELDAEIACGDGYVDTRPEAGEQCDPGDERSYIGKCMNERQGRCDPVTCQIDYSVCFPSCGNGMLDEGEECDPDADLDDLAAAGGKPCEDLDPPGPVEQYEGGISLRCLADCRWDRTDCHFCGDDQRTQGGPFPEMCDGPDIVPEDREDFCYNQCVTLDIDPAPTSVSCQARCRDDCSGLELLADPRCCLPAGETVVDQIPCCNPPAPADPTICGPGFGG
jgi:hypothetical protein